MGKYVGLKNQGLTCYMNSLLQQLFMVPEVRNGFLGAALPDRVDPGASIIADEGGGGGGGGRGSKGKKVGKKKKKKKKEKEKEKGSTNVVVEDGSRAAAGAAAGAGGWRGRVWGKGVKGSKDETDKIEKFGPQLLALLREVQRTFAFLLCSDRRAYDPLGE